MLIPIPQRGFLPNLVKISSMVLESEHVKCISLYNYKPMYNEVPTRRAIFRQILFLRVKFTHHVPRMLYVKYLSIWMANS